MNAPASNPPRPTWASGRAVAAIVAAIAALKLAIGGATGLVPDEGYYTLWSLYPSWGYLDHPPMVAWLIAAGRFLAGNNELGVRLIAALSGAVVAAALYRIGVLLFDRSTAALAAVLYTLTPFAALTLLATPDAPLILFWILALWAVAEFLASHNANWWLAAGAFVGLGLSAKLSAAFLPIGLLLYVLVRAERRRWLLRWQVWAGAGLALLVVSPVLWWNAANNWIMIWFQGRRVAAAESFGTGFAANITEFAGGQLLVAGPIVAILALVAAAAYALGRGGPARRGLGLVLVTALPFIAYLIVHTVHSRVEANWMLPAWPGLILAGAWAATRPPPGTILRILSAAGAILQLAFGVVVVSLIFAQALVQPFRPSPAFDRTRDLAGWQGTWAEIERLAQARGGRWVAVYGDYGTTGELATYAAFAEGGLEVHQLDDRMRYRFRPFDPAALGWPAIYVVPTWQSSPQAAPETWFGNVVPLGVIPRRRNDEVLGEFAVYLVDTPNARFSELAGS